MPIKAKPPAVILVPDKDFLNKSAPPGYKAGIGRGAVGFTTRADLPLARLNSLENTSDNEDLSNDEDDDAGLLGKKLSQRDAEAERAWDLVERARKSAPSHSPSPQTKQDQEASKPKLNYDWANLPDAMDMTKRNKRLRTMETQSKRSYALPDSMLGQPQANSMDMAVVEGNASETNGKGDTNILRPEPPALSELPASVQWRVEQEASSGQDRARLLQLQLDLASSTQIDEAKTPRINDQQQDLHKLKGTLQSHVLVKPNDGQAYIRLAQTEEKLQNYKAARHTINVATRRCPKDELVWLECLRFCRYKASEYLEAAERAILALPHSTALWQERINAERNNKQKLAAAHRALELNLQSAKLWNLAAELEVNMETREQVLESALEFCASDDHTSTNELVTELARLRLKRGAPLGELARQLANDSWSAVLLNANKELHLNEAPNAQEADNLDPTCLQFLLEIKALKTLKLMLNDNISSTILSQMEAIYGTTKCHEILSPLSEQLALRWLKQTPNSIELAKLAVSDLPVNKKVWQEIVPRAPDLLAATINNTNNTEQLLALYEIALELANLCDNGLFVKQLLDNAKIDLTPQLKARFAMHLSDLKITPEITKQIAGLQSDFWQWQYALVRSRQDDSQFLKLLGAAVQKFPQCVILWRLLANSAAKADAGKPSTKTNYIYTRALTIVSKEKQAPLVVDKLYYELQAGLELTHHLSAALSQFPSSGELLALKLASTQRVFRKAAVEKALNEFANEPYLLLAAGLEAWASSNSNNNNNASPKDWLEQAVAKDPLNGDLWLWLYNFSASIGEEQQILERFLQIDARSGRIWSQTVFESTNYLSERSRLFVKRANELVNPFTGQLRGTI